MATETQTQLGILFGFVGLLILFFIGFGIIWRMRNKREAKRELERKERIIEMGFGPKEMWEGEKGKGRDDV